MVNINIITLNNKSRKGTYLYIKEKKNKAQYYKLREGDNIDAYIQYYKDRYINKKAKGTPRQYQKEYQKAAKKEKSEKRTPIRRQAEQYISRIKKQPGITEIVTKGIGTAKIKNAYQTNNAEIRKANKEMLQELVLDKRLLEILTTEENLKKLAYRIEHRITYQDKDGLILATSNKFNTTTNKLVQGLKDKIKKGISVDSGSGSGRKTEFSDKLKILKHTNIDERETGKVSKISIEIIFRKG